MASSSDIFLEALTNCTLLSADKLAQAKEFAQHDPNPLHLAENLVKQQWMTDWQVKKLLAGNRQFHLGKYRLLDRLGRGGMGTVYRAEHIVLHRQVALKVMSRRYLTNECAVARFLAEIRMVSELDHPNIVKAFDADLDFGRYFLAMEYVPGQSLEQWLDRKGRFFVGWTCECIRQAALGLQHAAERNLIHRDVKPSNLIVPANPTESQPLVKLLDFGLAFSVGEMENLGITLPGRTVGTLDYMAPEQAASSRDLDRRSDIYSLGCVFFHLLTGRLPFEGKNSIERLAKCLDQPAPPPSRFRPDLPSPIDQILSKMLDRDRECRFAWPIDVAEALEPFAEICPAMPPMGFPPKRCTPSSTEPA